MKLLRFSLLTLFALGTLSIQGNEVQGPLNDFSKALDLLSKAVSRSAGPRGTTSRPFSATELQKKGTQLKHVEPPGRPASVESAHLEAIRRAAEERERKKKLQGPEAEREKGKEEVQKEQQKSLKKMIWLELVADDRITADILALLVHDNYITAPTKDALAEKLATLTEKDRRNFLSSGLPALADRALAFKIENLNLTDDELKVLKDQGLISDSTNEALQTKLFELTEEMRQQFFEDLKQVRRAHMSYWDMLKEWFNFIVKYLNPKL